MTDRLAKIVLDIQERKRLQSLNDPLYLNHWEDERKVFVPGHVAGALKRYHVMGLRFLYDCFRSNRVGAILNHDVGMNFQMQVAAFLNAMYSCENWKTGKTVVLCQREAIPKWHYHVTKHAELPLEVVNESNLTAALLKTTVDVIIVPLDVFPLIKEYKNQEFSCVVADDLDLISNKIILKQLRGKFKIGLTHKNFIKNRDPLTQWAMLNWANPGCVGKKAAFTEMDQEDLDDLIEPYIEWWQRLTWKFCETFIKITPDEETEYEDMLYDWCKKYNINGFNAEQRAARKRKSDKPNENRRLPNKKSSTNCSKNLNLPKLEAKANVTTQEGILTENNNKTVQEENSSSDSSGEFSVISSIKRKNFILDDSSEDESSDIGKQPEIIEKPSEIIEKHTVKSEKVPDSPEKIKNDVEPEKEFHIKQEEESYDDNSILTAIIEGSPLKRGVTEPKCEESITRDSLLRDLFESPKNSQIEKEIVRNSEGEHTILLSIMGNQKTDSKHSKKEQILTELFHENVSFSKMSACQDDPVDESKKEEILSQLFGND